ncbi:NAD(P)-dependent alcohol dehydrogenase [Gulosibacter molinativorax]|uniref:alcohol dehydrogenase (NADP(+)) n=1 Tax=Gulosibacter molinativorax TaxID=256821 RepID=A0ABT7CA59_9MICO|nr:NAD(P)-dependent alcohol dehydrogenase [Gulosibacter molinativorax]MDJ1371684.1 NAD(P)-dependent alcohol dehydrogenase [Gulosibacter molinativorax]QUY63106.1 NADP-dependent alcohol dehydrogenase [Gulosibacter molinativorax]
MRTVNAYGSINATDPLVPMTIERRDVGPHDVLIDIDYAGICHSDIHTIRGEWGEIAYPQVVGHEIVGRVAEVGSEVTKHRVGDTVGVGCQSNSCRTCEQCQLGHDQYCLNGNTQTYGSVDADGTITQGGYSEAIVTNEDYVLGIPAGLDPAKAAPLLCAGITTYSPLKHWGAGPGKHVAILGMGGLGHMGVKLAVALGADVTVLSRGTKKRDDALAFGAQRYVDTTDAAAMAELRDSLDVIVSTISAGFDVTDYLKLLRVDGTFVNVGAPSEPFTIPPFLLGGRRRALAGSTTGGIAEIQEMLEFCAEHGIHPETELVAAEGINEAWERVLSSDVRYRFVIDAHTL